ncbi:MAG: hypothetical protein V1698_01360 [bacterium]
MEHLKFDEEKETEKESINWKKIKKATQILAFSALVSFFNAESSLASDNKKVEKTRDMAKVEMLSEKMRSNINGKMGEIPTAQKDFNGKNIIVGYSQEGGKANWVICDVDDIRFFDKGADGVVDRVIVNKEKGISGKVSFIDLKTFESMDKLAKEAQITSDLEPEKIQLFEFQNQKIKSIDFNSGETAELEGEDAGRIITSAQERFSTIVDEANASLVTVPNRK